jgi:hypothetical protein
MATANIMSSRAGHLEGKRNSELGRKRFSQALPGFETCWLDLKFAACSVPLFFDNSESTGFVNDAATEGIVVNKTKSIKPCVGICETGYA